MRKTSRVKPQVQSIRLVKDARASREPQEAIGVPIILSTVRQAVSFKHSRAHPHVVEIAKMGADLFRDLFFVLRRGQ